MLLHFIMATVYWKAFEMFVHYLKERFKANQPSEHLKYNTVNEGDRKRRVAYQYVH